MDQFLADVRFALRGMRRRPGVSLLTVATLAVGIAANATLFSILDALLLRPLDFPEIGRLVRLWESSPTAEAFDRSSVAPANFLDWKEQSAGAFSKLVALEWWEANVRGREAPERAQGFFVSPEFFDVVGTLPPLGRGFLAEEGQAARRHSVVLGDDLWRRSFAADPAILGRSVPIDGEAFTVVGVAPPGFRFPEGAELWAPLALSPAGAVRDRHYLSVIGRLAPGRSLREAASLMGIVAERLEQQHPATNLSRSVVVTDLQRGYEDIGLRGVLAVWQAAAAFLLLIACVNVANLTLARASEREGELAVRLALGARRGRVVRQLLTEGMLSALAAVALSAPLAWLATRELRAHMPAEIARFVPGWQNIDVDGRLLLFSILIACACTLLFGAWPALRASRPDLAETLKDGGRSGTAGARRQLGRNLLVAAEVASALALLVGAGLAVRSATRLLSGPQGYDPDGMLTLQVTLPEARYQDPQSRRVFTREVAARLAAVPGAERVALANVLPARGSNTSRPVLVEGALPPASGEAPGADLRLVSAGFFETLGIPLLAGRGIQASDDQDALPVAVVSRSMAERFWPGQDPLGRRFRAGSADAPLLTVIGVCGDVIHHWFARRNYPTFYQPYLQAPSAYMMFAVRVQGEPEALGVGVRKAVAAVDPDQPAHDVMSMRRAISRSTIGLQYGAAVMGVFGALALLLAVSGIYGVMAYRVSLREAEYGIRMALGASSGDLLRLTLGQASRLTALGIAAGLALAFGLGRAMESAFAGAVEPDPASFLAFSATLAACSLLAAWIPARRALAADPSRLLRSQ